MIKSQKTAGVPGRGFTVTQYDTMPDKGKLAPYASIRPGGVLYGTGAAESNNGMVSGGAQQPMGNVTSAVQPGQTVFTGDPNPPNPAAISGLAPGQSPTSTPTPNRGFQAGQPGQSPIISDGYDSYVDRSFSHAMRTLDPMISKNEDRFNQRMIDKGFSPNAEGYQDEYDNNSRRYNDLASAAAFNAMNFGAGRQDSDRQYGLNRDIFDLNELSTIDGMNRAWDSVDYRNAVFNTGREDQRYNQMLALFGMTPVGSVTPTNTSANFANSANAQLGALNAQNNLYGQAAQGIGNAIGSVDWGSIFNSWGFGNKNNSSVDPATF